MVAGWLWLDVAVGNVVVIFVQVQTVSQRYVMLSSCSTKRSPANSAKNST